MSPRPQILVDTDQLDLTPSRIVEPQRIAASRHGMVASAHFCATDVGKQILSDGGNAIDAAVATALALGVCEPAASSIGGQTMMLIHLSHPRRTFALDGSSRAPNRATREAVADRSRQLRGHSATTVPSTLAALDYARRQYGTMRLSQLLAPAIRLAEHGYPITALQNRLTKRELRHLKANTAAALFLKDGHRAFPIWAIFRQPALAETLRRIARRGVKDFYHGQISRQIHEDMAAHGGVLHRDDLAQIPRPIERRPLSCHFGALRVITFPPPGAGRTRGANDRFSRAPTLVGYWFAGQRADCLFRHAGLIAARPAITSGCSRRPTSALQH
jgi:gamma-glutamyltranspeptidase/glutathione hydrolase